MFNKNFPKDNSTGLLDDILVPLPTRRDQRGALTIAQHGDIIEGFQFERAFWIYDVPQDAERGAHAHRTCAELFVVVHGSFDLELFDGRCHTTLHLDRPDQAVLIRPMVWCRLHNFSPDFVGLCLASQEYLPEGYINSLEEYRDEMQKTAH